METIEKEGWRKTLCTITVTSEEQLARALEARNLSGLTWNELFFKGVEEVLRENKPVIN